MSIFKSLRQYFSYHCETSENHEDPLLQTHYYKTTSKKALQLITEKLEKLSGYRITSSSIEHGELGVEIRSPKNGFLVISIVSVRPLETAVDFSVTYEGLLSLGFCRKVVTSLYKHLDQELDRVSKS